MRATKVIGILGGMGPAAGVELARLFVQACERRLCQAGCAVVDQAYPEHYLAQLPVPDRTASLLAPAMALDPEAEMKRALGRLVTAGATTVGIACNTAHAWHGKLQGAFPAVELLHVAQEVMQLLIARGITRVGLLATRGTYLSGVYGQLLAQAGVFCAVPTDTEREALMEGIYRGVKAGDRALALERFRSVAAAMIGRHGLDCLILGCTEIPLVLDEAALKSPALLIDPAVVLADALAARAFEGEVLPA